LFEQVFLFANGQEHQHVSAKDEREKAAKAQKRSHLFIAFLLDLPFGVVVGLSTASIQDMIVIL